MSKITHIYHNLDKYPKIRSSQISIDGFVIYILSQAIILESYSFFLTHISTLIGSQNCVYFSGYAVPSPRSLFYFFKPIIVLLNI